MELGRPGGVRAAREVMLKRKLLKGLVAYTDEQIWEAVLQRKEASERGRDGSRTCGTPSGRSSPIPTRASTAGTSDSGRRAAVAYRKVIEKVVLAERMREVRALTGFTRIESPGDYTEIGDFPKEQRVP